VTVDKKPDTGKKAVKNVADVKPKPAEKTSSTTPAIQPSSFAAAAALAQVRRVCDMLLCDRTVHF